MPRRSVNAKDTSIPFHRPHIDQHDLGAVRDCLRGGWLTTGKIAAALEQMMAGSLMHNGLTPAAVAVSSCTAALHLALELQNLQPGDQVIVPTMTFTATAEAVVRAGLQPVIVDVSPSTLTLTPSLVAAKCTAKTKAILPVHYGGDPLGFLDILDFARQHKMRVIDDAAHAYPAAIWDREGVHHPIGSPGLSDATCFSFYATKTVTTGEGGMLILPNRALEERARRLTLHGIDADAYQRSRTAVYHYEVTEPGYKYNLPDVLAALGTTQVRKAEALRNTRKIIAERYRQALETQVKREWLTLPASSPDTESAHHLYPIRLNLARLATGWDRDRVGAAMKAQGIGTSMHYRPLHRHRYWATTLGIGAEAFPHADAAYAQLLSLPIWPGMSSKHIDRVAAALEQALFEAGR